METSPDELAAGMVFEYAAFDEHDVDRRRMEVLNVTDETVTLMFDGPENAARAPRDTFAAAFPNWELAADAGR